MVRYYFLFTFLILSGSIWCQDSKSKETFNFKITGKVLSSQGEKLEDVEIILTSHDTVLNIVTSENGKFKLLDLPSGKIYTLSFSKKGYITKSILLDFEKNDNLLDSQFSFEISPELVYKLNKRGYKKVENDFFICRMYINDFGHPSLDSKFCNEQTVFFQGFIKKKHHYVKD